MPAIAVMGVVNVTPDSFSDGGHYDAPADAVRRVGQLLEEGATFIDVGGESTRPGAAPIDPAQECARVLPVIEHCADQVRRHGARLSIDTRNEATARAAVAAGASLINDVSASLWPVAAELGVGWVAMHMAGDPRTMQTEPRYEDVVDEVHRFLVERASVAAALGVEVWVDPGIGFGKTTEHNLELLAHLDELVAEGFPVVVGTSRKRFLGELLSRSDAPGVGLGDLSTPASEPVVPVDRRLDGSLATATWAMTQGAQMVRAHEVATTVQAATIVAGGFRGS